jgi:cytochrome o ubiquinol oxidase subunit 1
MVPAEEVARIEAAHHKVLVEQGAYSPVKSSLEQV